MKIRWIRVLPMLAVAKILAVGEPAASEKQIEAGVRAEFARWTEAYKRHDLQETMMIFDPQVRFAFQGGPDVGYAELERSYAAEFKTDTTAEWVGSIDEVQASGDLAAEFSTWKLIEHRDGKEVELAQNRGMDLFRLNARGEWRIIRSPKNPLNAPGAPAKPAFQIAPSAGKAAGPRNLSQLRCTCFAPNLANRANHCTS
jgi:uncharacterized protein (TIGR02246 family)